MSVKPQTWNSTFCPVTGLLSEAEELSTEGSEDEQLQIKNASKYHGMIVLKYALQSRSPHMS
ncbi:hypothetical protein SCFA_280028 [anaerobic digester metagenome]|uniref:Uncharacterized protein n=1 Tax=anaerobic digester metagenome TaxID=1263854 RepID=A0A485M1N1_9ZZZZ